MGSPPSPSVEGGSPITGWLVVRSSPPTLDMFTPPPGLRTGHWMGRTGLGPGQAGDSAGHGCCGCCLSYIPTSLQGGVNLGPHLLMICTRT